MSLISHISPSQGSGNAKIHAVILLLKMLSIWWREICMWHLIRTQSTQHSERRIPRSLWERQGCGGTHPGGGDPLCYWWRFSAESSPSIIKADRTQRPSETPTLCKGRTFFLRACLLSILCIFSLVNYCFYSSCIFS